MIYRSPCQSPKNKTFLISLTHIRLFKLNWPNVTSITIEIPNKDNLISLIELINSMGKANNAKVFYFSSLRLNQVIFFILSLFITISDRLTMVIIDLINIIDLIITSRSNSPISLRCKSTQANSLSCSPLPGRPTKAPS